MGTRSILGRRLAGTPWQPHQLDAAPREASYDVVSTVRGGVGNDEHLAPIGGIVDLKNALQGGRDGRLLVVRGHRDAEQWPRVGLRRWAPRTPQCAEPQEQRVDEVCVHPHDGGA